MRQAVDAARARTFLEALSRATTQPTTVYLVGGATAVMVGWRASTIDLDIVLEPEDEGALRALPRLKEELHTNVELASPLDFLPPLPGWRDRSLFVIQLDRLTVRQFDPYAQVLAKLERGFTQDLLDVQAMIERSMVDPARLLELFDSIAGELYRFPSVAGNELRAAVQALAIS
jgi:hypothetical protein